MKSDKLKKELEQALKHAREYLGYYVALPVASGFFGTQIIQNLVGRGEKYLNNFDDLKLIEVDDVKNIIEELNDIQ